VADGLLPRDACTVILTITTVPHVCSVNWAGSGWRADCKCGWESQIGELQGDALADAHQHVDHLVVIV
jgi:hypothetical protein